MLSLPGFYRSSLFRLFCLLLFSGIGLLIVREVHASSPLALPELAMSPSLKYIPVGSEQNITLLLNTNGNPVSKAEIKVEIWGDPLPTSSFQIHERAKDLGFVLTQQTPSNRAGSPDDIFYLLTFEASDTQGFSSESLVPIVDFRYTAEEKGNYTAQILGSSSLLTHRDGNSLEFTAENYINVHKAVGASEGKVYVVTTDGKTEVPLDTEVATPSGPVEFNPFFTPTIWDRIMDFIRKLFSLPTSSN